MFDKSDVFKDDDKYDKSNVFKDDTVYDQSDGFKVPEGLTFQGFVQRALCCAQHQPSESMQALHVGKSDRVCLEHQIANYVKGRVLKHQDRQNIGPRGMCLGLHTSRGAWVTKATHQHSVLLQWCHKLAASHGIEYTSIQINVSTQDEASVVRLHQDRFNLHSYPNMIYVIGLSDFSGGRLWCESDEAGAQRKAHAYPWVKTPTWKELNGFGFPCSTIRELSTTPGEVLWRLWQCPKSPERRLYSVLVDGETMVCHKKELGLSHVLIQMGHSPDCVAASQMTWPEDSPQGIHPDCELWVYEANQTCGFFGMEEDDPDTLNHQQCCFFQCKGQEFGHAEENSILQECRETDLSLALFPVLLTPDEELAALETPEADGEDLPEEEH
eukprot:3628195-Amphidinium_carterae.1